MQIDQVSVIIPLAENEDSWPTLLSQLNSKAQGLEIILVACEAKPEHLKLHNHIQWLVAEKGRAKQQNTGALLASRSFLWFLHADSQLDDQAIPQLLIFTQRLQPVCGYFQLAFADDGPLLTRLNAWAANLRSQWFKLPFGDQGFILSKRLFSSMGGFDESLNIGEDLDFIVRLQARSIPLQPLDARITTSARRYQRYGWLQTSIKHIFLTFSLSRQARRRLKQ